VYLLRNTYWLPIQNTLGVRRLLLYKNGSPYFEPYRLGGEGFIGSLQLTRVEVEIKKGPFASRHGVS
jgi:hypothetical protein